LTVDTDELSKLAQQADQILFEREAEANLIRLLEIKEQVEEMISAAKTKIEETALAINPNFKAVIGEKIRVGYQYFGGQKYLIDDSYLPYIPSELILEETKRKVDMKALVAYERQYGHLPQGIKAANRNKSISFRLKKDKVVDAPEEE